MTRSGRTYYLLFGGYSLAQFFIAPVYPLYLVSRGLDLFQINAVLATYLITVFAFDVPTGALADVAGRRRSFVLGCLVRATAYLLYTRADGFASCLVYEFIDALGTTFVSGALDAWAVDGVRAEGHRGAVDALFARASAIGRALMIVGGIVCGYLAEASLVFPWIAAAALFVACAVVGALRMHEPPRVPRERRTLHGTALAGVRTVRDAPVLVLLCTLSLVAAFAAFPVHMLWQPRLEELAQTRFAILGWVVAAFNVSSLVGSALLPHLLGRFRREAVLAGAAIWRALMVAMLAGAGTVSPAVVGLVLQEAAFGVTDPVVVGWTNEHVASAQRATVLSVRTTFVTLGGAAGLVVLGLVARHAGLPTVFAASAVLLALTAPGYLLLARAVEPAPAAATNVGPPALG